MSEQKEVLIVDDDESIAYGLSRRLQAAGYATQTASDGALGVAAAHDHPPDVILLDVMMPNMDGITALRQLRTSWRTRHVPVIMLSASLSGQHDALDAGARFFLKKPYNHEHLFAAVENAVSREPVSTSYAVEAEASSY